MRFNHWEKELMSLYTISNDMEHQESGETVSVAISDSWQTFLVMLISSKVFDWDLLLSIFIVFHNNISYLKIWWGLELVFDIAFGWGYVGSFSSTLMSYSSCNIFCSKYVTHNNTSGWKLFIYFAYIPTLQ